MEFLKIISDDSSIELIPLSKVFSMKITMGKLYINGESKHLKVENSEEFLNKYVGIIGEEMSKVLVCIKNENGYARIFADDINIE